MQINNIFALQGGSAKRTRREKCTILQSVYDSVCATRNSNNPAPGKIIPDLKQDADSQPVSYRIFSSVEEMSVSFFGNSGNVFLSRPYLSAMETAAPVGVEFRYAGIYRGGVPKGFFYFQIIPVFEKNTTRLIQPEPYHSLVKGILKLSSGISGSSKKVYVIIQGNACLSGPWFWQAADDNLTCPPVDLEQLHHSLKMEVGKKGKVLATVIKDLTSDYDAVSAFVKNQRFLQLPMQPLMQMSIRPEWKSMDDYVNSLSAKYRKRFLQAQSKLAGCEIRAFSLEEMVREKPAIDRLYEQVKEKSPVQLFRTDVTYLIALKKNLGDTISVKGIFHEGRLVAFLSGIRSGGHYEAHHIGIDYNLNRTHSLYLNILFGYIQLAIESGSSLLSFGRTAMEMKTTVGAVPVYQDTFLKFNHRILNSLVRPFIAKEPVQDWTPRDPFKR